MALDHSKIVNSHSLSETSPLSSTSETRSAEPPTSADSEEKILVPNHPNRPRITQEPSNSVISFDLALATEEVVDG